MDVRLLFAEGTGLADPGEVGFPSVLCHEGAIPYVPSSFLRTNDDDGAQSQSLTRECPFPEPHAVAHTVAPGPCTVCSVHVSRSVQCSHFPWQAPAASAPPPAVSGLFLLSFPPPGPTPWQSQPPPSPFLLCRVSLVAS